MPMVRRENGEIELIRPVHLRPTVPARIHGLSSNADLLAAGQPLLHGRAYLLLYSLLDAILLGALFLQLTPPGLPRSVDALVDRIQTHVRDRGETAASFWFWPVSVAAAGPLVCGAFLGVLCRSRCALWMYASGALVCVAVRCYFLFEQSRHEHVVETQPLLIDMLVMSIAIFVELSASERATTLALELRRNAVAARYDRSLRRRSGEHTSTRRGRRRGSRAATSPAASEQWPSEPWPSGVGADPPTACRM
jgi:hypothetical protein